MKLSKLIFNWTVLKELKNNSYADNFGFTTRYISND